MRLNRGVLRQQRGMAVIIMLLILVVGGAYFLVSELGRARGENDRSNATADALAKAKEALIAYAVTYYDDHPGEFGMLPCPDLDSSLPPIGEGYTKATCGSKNMNSLGRFPWKSLNTNALRDGNGECLWYAVSGTYKGGSTKADMVNDDSNGMFRVYDSNNVMLTGATPETRSVAVIIAPGALLPGQDRQTAATGTEVCGGSYTPSAYLESRNSYNNSDVATIADTIDAFVTATDRITSSDPSAPFNDRVIYITQAELWRAVKQRTDFAPKIDALLSAAALCVADYGTNLPWAAPVDLGDYRVASVYDDASGAMAGRLPDVVDTSGGGPVMTGCTSISAENTMLWKHWKDHLFYAIANEFKPGTGTRSCSDPSDKCLVVTGAAGKYASVVIFSDERLSSQTRNVSPPDTETKSTLSNYLESSNLSSHPNTLGTGTYTDGTVTATFNDSLYLIDDSMIVTPGPGCTGTMGSSMGAGMGGMGSSCTGGTGMGCGAAAMSGSMGCSAAAMGM